MQVSRASFACKLRVQEFRVQDSRASFVRQTGPVKLVYRGCFVEPVGNVRLHTVIHYSRWSTFDVKKNRPF